MNDIIFTLPIKCNTLRIIYDIMVWVCVCMSFIYSLVGILYIIKMPTFSNLSLLAFPAIAVLFVFSVFFAAILYDEIFSKIKVKCKE